MFYHSVVRDALPILSPETRDRSAPALIQGDGSDRPSFFDAMIEHVNLYRHLAAANLQRIANAYVFDNMVFTFDGSTLKPCDGTWRAVDQPPRGGASFLDHARRVFDAGGHREIAGPAFFVGSSGSYNYGHWLVDDLPRALLCERHVEPGAPILVSGYDDAINFAKIESLHATTARSPCFIDRAFFHRVDDLTFCDPISFHPMVKSRVALGVVAQRVLGAVETASNPRHRLFVDRTPKTWREVVNRTNVEAFCAEHGFEIIRPETMTFLEQVRVFASAEIVVGVMGAGMTNVIFAPPDAQVLFLAPLGWEEPFYWDLCDTIGLPYAAYFGEPKRVGDDPAAWNFAVDFGAVTRLLEL